MSISFTLVLYLCLLLPSTLAVEVFYFKFVTPQNTSLSIPLTNYPSNSWRPQNAHANDTNHTLLEPIHILERVLLNFVNQTNIVPNQPDPSTNRIFSSCIAIGTERCLIFTNRSGQLVPPLNYHEFYDNSSDKNAHTALHIGFVNEMVDNNAFTTVPCPSNITLDNGTVIPSPFMLCTEFVAAMVYANEYQVTNIGTPAGAGSNNNDNQDYNNKADPSNVFFPSIYSDAPSILVKLLDRFTANFADVSLQRNGTYIDPSIPRPSNQAAVPANISVLLSQLGVLSIEQGYYTFLSVQKTTFPVMIVMVGVAAVIVVIAFIVSYICMRRRWAAADRNRQHKDSFMRDDDAYSMPDRHGYGEDEHGGYSSYHQEQQQQNYYRGETSQNEYSNQHQHHGASYVHGEYLAPQGPEHNYSDRHMGSATEEPPLPTEEIVEDNGDQDIISPNESHTFVSESTFQNNSMSSKNFGPDGGDNGGAESQAQFREAYEIHGSPHDASYTTRPKASTLSTVSEMSNNAFGGSQLNSSGVVRGTQPFISMAGEEFKQ